MRIVYGTLVILVLLNMLGAGRAGISVGATSVRVHGVHPGDWAKYALIWNYTSDDPEMPRPFNTSDIPDYMTLEVLSVDGTNITFRMTLHFTNGTEKSNIGWDDVSFGFLWFIAANLSIGDIAFSAKIEFIINEVVNATYAGVEREMNCVRLQSNNTDIFNVTTNEDLLICWDKASGILTQETTTQIIKKPEGYVTYSFGNISMIETNIWFAGDVDTDGKVTLKDVWLIARAFGSHAADYPNPGDPASPNWNPKCDINNDKVVNVKDIYSAARNFGK